MPVTECDPEGARERENASPSCLLRGFHGVAAEVFGGGGARENRDGGDKSTAAL